MRNAYDASTIQVWNVEPADELRGRPIADERQFDAIASSNTVYPQARRKLERQQPTGHDDLDLDVVDEPNKRWHYESAAQKSRA